VTRLFDRMSPLQREITAGLLSGEDADSDESLAERHGTTSGGVRIERQQARSFLREALGSEAESPW
jgi:hypothetical protein